MPLRIRLDGLASILLSNTRRPAATFILWVDDEPGTATVRLDAKSEHALLR